MDLITVAAYAAAVFMGVAQGLLGGGGAMITIPVLVYLMGFPADLAAAHSLFIVGVTTIAGTVQYLRRGWVDVRIGVLFAIPSLGTVYVVRKWVVPALPDPLFGFEAVGYLSKHTSLMLLFVVMMIAAGVYMIRPKKAAADTVRDGTPPRPIRIVPLLVQSAFVGAALGLVGAGGGFLIVPALTLLAGLPPQRAVATSLLIIGANTSIGFLGDLGRPLNWPLLFIFSGFTLTGLFFGTWLSARIQPALLRKAFGFFVLSMAAIITTAEVIVPLLRK